MTRARPRRPDGDPRSGVRSTSVARAAAASATAGGHHDAVVGRLRRVDGQVRGILRMYQEGRYCIEVLDQVSAARRGLQAAALLILEDHVDTCVGDTSEEGRKGTSAEVLAAIRRFVRSV